MKFHIVVYGAAFAVLSAGAMAQTSGSQRAQEHGPGQMLDYPHEKTTPGSDKPMDRRGADMPGSQGMMPDHPHEKMGPGSDKPMDRRGADMPGGQGMMPGHPHQDQKK